MSQISDFIFKANKKLYKKRIDLRCKEYEPDFVKKIYHYENNKLMGLVIYFDYEGTRWIREGHCLSKNRFIFLKAWRNLFRDKNINCWKVNAQKDNTKMIEFYKNMKFKIIEEDEFNLYFELRRI